MAQRSHPVKRHRNDRFFPITTRFSLHQKGGVLGQISSNKRNVRKRMNFEAWHVAVTAIVLLFLGGVVLRWVAVLWSVFKASKMASQGTSTLLEEAAESMMAGPPQQWVIGCLHLLKAVEIRARRSNVSRCSRTNRGRIRVRLETGDWPGHGAQAETAQGAKR